MTRRATLAATIVGLAIATVASASPVEDAGISISTPVHDLKFYVNKDGLIFANAWGDPATGPHSNYIRLAGHYASPPHTHTSSYYGVVISGVVSNERPDAPDRPLPAGSYWFQNGQDTHVTKCLSSRTCLIFVTADGPFDIFPVAPAAARTGTAQRR